MTPDELPRERLNRAGPEALTLSEILAILLGTSFRPDSGPAEPGSLLLARELVNSPGSGLPVREQERAFFHRMEISGVRGFGKLRGLGAAQQARLLAAFELGRRYSLHRNARPSELTHRSLDPLSLREQALRKVPEECRISPREKIGFVPIYLNGRGLPEPGDYCLVETGSQRSVQFEPSELFARVLALRPRAFFLFHNHPSGDPSPSPEDHELTEQVQSVGRSLAIPCLGHAVLTAKEISWIKTT